MSLEVVQLFQDDGWNDDIVFFERFKAIGRIENDIGVDDEILQRWSPS